MSATTKRPRTDYSRRPKQPWLPYPALILDSALLDSLGVTPGTRPDEDPPKVVMTLADWRKVVAHPLIAQQAIQFLGTGSENPLKGLPDDPEPGPGTTRPRKPGPFAHLRNLPMDAATQRAKQDHEARVAGGMNPEKSLTLLVKALETVKRWGQERVIPAPLHPEAATDEHVPLRDYLIVRHARTGDLWTAKRPVTDDHFTLTPYEDASQAPERLVSPRQLRQDYEVVEQLLA